MKMNKISQPSDLFVATDSLTDELTTPPALEMRGLRHGFGSKEVLKGVSLSVAPGGFLCLLGPSGCGKTTTLRLAAGLETPWEGEIWINGHQVSGPDGTLPPEDRRIGYLFQDFALFPHLTVLDNVMFGIMDRPKADRQATALEKLTMVGMADYAKAYPHTLSGGQQQRVALARALAPDPQLMLLDEPFSGLDARLRHQIRAETFQVLKDNGVAAVMVTHDPEEAMFMADCIALMDGGNVVQCDVPAALWHRPATPFAARFFGEINELSGTVTGAKVSTALGPLPLPRNAHGAVADWATEGSEVLVMIRPAAFQLSEITPANRSPLYVRSVRHLGPVHRVRMGIHGTDDSDLLAHVHDVGLLQDDADVGFTLQMDEVFLFPKS